ncbi:hypothetical protein [Streptomyces sp. CC53]|uniref:hypothetical protein n=1 Tax=Streptomyces sp. CC53 TaxID=1906740 RepID=UPI0015A64B04|nr:hypothetical protein [Streptomyces sp. CC53]
MSDEELAARLRAARTLSQDDVYGKRCCNNLPIPAQARYESAAHHHGVDAASEH